MASAGVNKELLRAIARAKLKLSRVEVERLAAELAREDTSGTSPRRERGGGADGSTDTRESR